VTYKCSTYYDGSVENGFYYADPDGAIDWPEGIEIAGELPSEAAWRASSRSVGER